MDLVGALAPRIHAGLGETLRCLVAIDGPDTAGKTTLADRLAAQVGPHAERVSLDDFLRPAEQRHARGRLSPQGYYEDSFATATFLADVRDPFEARTTAGTLIVDGVFLLQPELRDRWHLAVYLHVPDHVALERALVRDARAMGGAEEVRERYRRRYLPGQALYRERDDPVRWADVVVDNSRPDMPTVLRGQEHLQP